MDEKTKITWRKMPDCKMSSVYTRLSIVLRFTNTSD